MMIADPKQTVEPFFFNNAMSQIILPLRKQLPLIIKVQNICTSDDIHSCED